MAEKTLPESLLLRRLKDYQPPAPQPVPGPPPQEVRAPFRSRLLDRLEDQSVRPIHEQKTRLFPEGRVANFLEKYQGTTPGLLATAEFLKKNPDISWKQYYEIRAQLRADQPAENSQTRPATAKDGTTVQ